MEISSELQGILRELGIYANEACDRCARILGPVRYTRGGDSSVWCSRQCRDGADSHAPGTCWSCGASLTGLRRGTKFCSGTCRKRENRKSPIALISRDERLKTHDLKVGVKVLAVSTQPGLFHAAETR